MKSKVIEYIFMFFGKFRRPLGTIQRLGNESLTKILRMRHFAHSLLIVFFLLGMLENSTAQLNGNGYCLSSPTDYTTLIDNDSIYFYTEANVGSLTATPESGVPGWNFTWQTFNIGTNSWIPFSTENGVPESTINNLPAGGYRVTITDGNGDVVGCYSAWISEYLTFPSVDVEPIPPGCGAVNLVGTIDGGSATSYYNAPPDPMIIDLNTEITVCFTANHTFVSDLGFYLVGPATCGSPVIPLATSPGVCNGGDNLNNLCFSTESVANFNVCTVATPATGTYGTYGAVPTPINWAPLYGCDATTPGWAVQIYDCVGLDVGNLTGATISFNGISTCGEPLALSYTTPPGFNSPIADNSCSPQSASIFTVPIPPVTPLNPLANCGFLWTADPYFFIPDSTTSLNITLNPGPTQSTTFTLSIVCDEDGDGENDPNGCGGGNISDSEFYAYISPEFLAIEDPGTICEGEAVILIGTPPGGDWSGDFVDPSGNFSPPGPGDYTVNYSFPGPCSAPASQTITVQEAFNNFSFFDGGTLCPYDAPVFIELCEQPGNCNLSANPAVIEIAGELFFDPSLAIPGANSYQSEFVISECASEFTEAVFNVEEVFNASLLDPGVICSADNAVQLEADFPGGEWSGMGITDPMAGFFDPAAVAPGMVDIVYTTPGFCPIDELFSIEVNSNPTIDLGLDITACEGETVTLDAGGSWDQVTWTDALNQSTAGNSIDVSTPSTLAVEIILGGCSGEDVITVNFTPIPVIDLGADIEICAGESVLISAPYIGDWSDSSVGDELEVSASGTYGFVYDNSGCPTSDEIVVEVLPLIEPTIEPIASLCEDAATINLSADIAGGSWSGTGILDITAGSFDAPTAGPGIYNVEYSIAEQCAVTVLAQIEVVGFQNLALLTPDPACAVDDAFNLEAGIDGGIWSGIGITDENSGEFDPQVSGSGTFDISYTITGVCIDTDQITVEVQDIPILEIGDPGLVCGMDIPFALDINLAGGEWSGDGITDENTGIFNPAAAGNGVHTIQYQLDGVCSAETSIDFEVIANPNFNLGDDISICEDQTAVLDAGNDWDTVEWIGISSDSSIEVNTEGSYTAIVELNGCASEDEVFLTVIAYPIIELDSPIEICEGDVYTIEAPFPGNWSTGLNNSNSLEVSEAGTYTYIYQNSGCPVQAEVILVVIEYPIIDVVPAVEFCLGVPVTVFANQIVTWTGVASGEAESIQVSEPGVLIAQKSNGNCTTVETIDVIELPLPFADLGPDIDGCLGDNYTLNAFSEVNDSYLWSTGDEVEFIIASENGLYSVQTTNSCGTAYDDINIKLEDCSAQIFIPNAFTPNGDGLNDEWKPVVRNLAKYKLQIYNRWGEVVFETEDWNDPWLGEFNEGDHFVQTEVYNFRMTYLSIEGEAGDVNGHITVVR